MSKHNWDNLFASISEEVLANLPSKPIGFNPNNMTVPSTRQTNMDGRRSVCGHLLVA